MADNLNIILSAKIEEQSIKGIETQIKQLQDRINKSGGIKLTFDQNLFKGFETQVDTVQRKIQKVFQDSKVSDLGYGDLQQRIQEINKSAQEQAKITVQTYKNTKNIKNATIEYVDASGKAVKETMAWTSHLDKANNTVKKVFQTTGFTFTDNIKKAKDETIKLNQQLDLYKQKMLGGNGVKGEIDIFSEKHKGNFDSNALAKIRADVKNLNADMPNLSNQIKQTSTNFSLLKQSATESSNVMVRALENAGKFLRFYLVGGALVGAINTLKNSVGSVIALDDALVELNKVADVTNSELTAIINQSFDLGKSLARTGTEVVATTAEFVKAGFSIQESMKLAENSLLLMNVGGTDLNASTDVLISSLENFNISAEDSIDVVNKLNQVSNTTSSSVSGLADGLQRTAGVLGQTGTTIDETLGLLVAGFTTLRNMEKVSSGIITIASRIKRMSDSSDELSKLVPKLEDEFKQLGLTLLDSNGELKSTFDILQSLSKVYPTLNSLSKENINFLVSGTRQSAVLTAILNDFDLAEKSVTESINSQNSALKENQAVLDSISGKARIFASSVQSLWNNTIDSNILKLIVDFGTGIVNIIDKIGILNIALLTTIGYFSLIKGMSLTSMITTIITSITQLNGAVTGLNLSLSSFAPLAIVIGVMALVGAFNELYVTVDEQKEKVSELTSEYDSLNKKLEELKSIKSPTESQQAEIRILERQLELQKELLDIEKQRLMRKEVFGIGNFGGGVSGEIDKDINAFNGLTQSLKSANDEIQMYQDLANSTNDDSKKAIFTEKANDAIAYAKSLNDSLKEVELSLLDNQVVLQDYAKNAVGVDKKAIDDLLIKINNIIPKVQEYTKVQQQNTNITKENADANIDLSESLATITKATEDFAKTSDTAISTLSELNEVIDQVSQGESLNADQIADLIMKYPELASAIKTTSDGYTIQKSALESLRQIKIDEQRIAINAEVEKSRIALQETANRVQAYGLEIGAITDLASARHEMNKVGFAVDEGYGDEVNYSAEEMQIRNAIQAYGNLLEKSKVLQELLNNRKLGVSTSKSSTKSQTDPYSAQINQYQALEDAIAKYNYGLEQNRLLTEQAEGVDKINLLKERNALYVVQQDNLHKLNDARDEEILKNKQLLEQQGFLVQYDKDYNILAIGNLEKLNTLKGKTQEETNELRKKYEDLIKSTYELNNANREGSKEFNNITNAMADTTEQIQATYDAQRDAAISIESEIIQALKDRDSKEKELETNRLNRKKERLQNELEDELEALQKKKEIYEEDYESYKESIESKYQTEIDVLKRQKELLQEQANEEDHIAEQQERRDKLANLQSQYNKAGVSDQKRYELSKQISELQTEIRDAEKEYTLQSYLDQIDETIEAKETEKDNLLTIAETERDEYLKILDDKEAKTKASYERLIANVEDDLKDLENSHTNYAREASNIMQQSQTEILAFLQANSSKWAEMGELQGQAYLDELKDKLDLAKGLISNTTPVSSGGSSSGGSDYSDYDPWVDDNGNYLGLDGNIHNVNDDDDSSSSSSSGSSSSSSRSISDIARDNNVDMGVAEDMKRTNDRLGYDKYHDGGFVGGEPLDPRHEEIAKLLKGELTIPPIQLDQLVQRFGLNVPKFQTPQIVAGNGMKFDINLNMGGVQISNDYDLNKVTDTIMTKMENKIVNIAKGLRR